MNTKLLRQQILDLAIRGKLVKQDPNDEPASVLLERIRAEKEQLIQQGKIKKTKAPATTDTPHYQNTPFDIPNSWQWVRLGEIANLCGGYAFKSTDIKGSVGYRVIRISDITLQGLSNTSIVRYSGNAVPPQFEIQANDILIAMTGGTVGKSLLLQELSEKMYINQRVASVRTIIANPYYLYIAIISTLIQDIIKYAKNSTNDNISMDDIYSFPIPFPPLAEQKRIVAEVEKWFVLIDDLEANKQDLQAAIKQVRAKVLDLAIHGKLVPQDPDDEPAIDLLHRINPHFAPSDISHYENVPNGWEVCRLEDAFEIVMGSSPNGSSLNVQKQGVEFHQGKICFTDMYLKHSDTYTIVPTKFAESNSVLLCVRAPVGVVNLTDRKICIGRGLCALKPKQGIDLLFVFYALQTHKDHFDEQATGTTFKAISGDTIRCETFLLPPYNEQIRIRKKIEIILQQLDTISAEL